MNLKKSRNRLKVFSGVIIMLVFTMNSFSRIIANRGEAAFVNTGENQDAIKQAIIQGAGYFLEAYADTLMFLNRVEISGIQYVPTQEYRDFINRAITGMEKAVKMYDRLCQLSSITPYCLNFRDKLTGFDYDKFSTGKNLNAGIFLEVKQSLVNGEVGSLFAKLRDKNKAILNILYRVKSGLDEDILPGLEDLWQINQWFSETLMLGQCAAQLFYSIVP